MPDELTILTDKYQSVCVYIDAAREAALEYQAKENKFTHASIAAVMQRKLKEALEILRIE